LQFHSLDAHLPLDARGRRPVWLSPLHATGYGLWWATFRKLESRMSKSGCVSGLQPFLFNRPPTGTLLKNRPHLWF